MAKGNKVATVATVAPVATVAAQAAPQAAPQVYVVSKRGAKYNPTGTKFGAKGNPGTWQAIQAAVQANGGTITHAQLVAVCNSMAHKGFAAYVVSQRCGWLVPQAPQA